MDDRLEWPAACSSQRGFATVDELRPLFTEQAPQPAPRYTGDGFRVRYLGHATLLIESRDVTILTDPISRHIHRFLAATGWQIDAVRVHDINHAAAETCAAEIRTQHAGTEATATPDLASAVRGAELVVFATVAGVPHVFDRTLFDHRPVILYISLRDLSAELILDAVNIVDDIDHVMQADTSPHLALKLAGTADFVTGTLADVIEERCTIDRTRTVVFSPFGLGVLDVAVGQWVYDRAAAEGAMIQVPDFFG